MLSILSKQNVYMAKTKEDDASRWQREVVIAYNTRAYCESFECYWDVTAVLRTDSSVDWDKIKKIKLAAWKELDK